MCHLSGPAGERAEGLPRGLLDLNNSAEVVGAGRLILTGGVSSLRATSAITSQDCLRGSSGITQGPVEKFADDAAQGPRQLRLAQLPIRREYVVRGCDRQLGL